MSLEAILSLDAIISSLKATSKKQLFQELAQMASSIWGLEERRVFESLLERERLGATCVGDGVAIPHARLPDLDEVHGVFARLSSPVDFDAPDEEPVDLVFLLLAPESANAAHLKALAKISRTLKRPDLRANLRGAVGEHAIYSMLTEDHMRAA